ncbi:MAG: hypothetical protein P1V35_07880 [Planctomycetota bacterium]|nr:hypothetical protein [Planctomycetota bacterium]
MSYLRSLAIGFALAVPATAQSLEWEIETEEFITSPGVRFQRPEALRPHLSDWPSFCDIYYDMNLNYDLTVTNLTNSPQTVFLGNNVLQGVVSGGWTTGGGCFTCWATSDPSGLFPISIDSVNLAPNEVRTVTGVAAWPGSYPMWRPVQYCTAFHSCGEDAVHGTASPIHYYPNGGAPTWQDTAAATIQDNGSYSSIDLRMRTHYELPQIAGPGACVAANPNSTGQTGQLNAYGVADLEDGLIVLSSTRLPEGQFGYYLVGSQAGAASPLGSGMGTLCLGGAIYRWHDSFTLIGADGVVNQEITPDNMPVPGGGLIGPSIWHFQFWHRDQAGGANTSNTTNGVSIAFN